MSKKHLQPLSEISITTIRDGNPNFQAIRYADALLMNTGASNKAGNNTNALEALNRVRKRACESHLYDTTLPNAGTVPTGLLPDAALTDQGQMHDAIRRRRHGALALEFQQFFDVVRYN